MPKIEPIGEPVDEEQIAAAEKRMGRPVPKEYRAFLAEHNGGIPEPGRFEFEGAGGKTRSSVLDYLLGVGVQRSLNIESFVSNYEDRIPPGFFPIGRDPGGNLILMGTEGGDDGKILFWDHEAEAEEDEEPTRDNVHPIADSLDKLLASLTPVE